MVCVTVLYNHDVIIRRSNADPLRQRQRKIKTQIRNLNSNDLLSYLNLYNAQAYIYNWKVYPDFFG